MAGIVRLLPGKSDSRLQKRRARAFQPLRTLVAVGYERRAASIIRDPFWDCIICTDGGQPRWEYSENNLAGIEEIPGTSANEYNWISSQNDSIRIRLRKNGD